MFNEIKTSSLSGNSEASASAWTRNKRRFSSVNRDTPPQTDLLRKPFMLLINRALSISTVVCCQSVCTVVAPNYSNKLSNLAERNCNFFSDEKPENKKEITRGQGEDGVNAETDSIHLSIDLSSYLKKSFYESSYRLQVEKFRLI